VATIDPVLRAARRARSPVAPLRVRTPIEKRKRLKVGKLRRTTKSDQFTSNDIKDKKKSAFNQPTNAAAFPDE
jgi:hypothetical protein